MSNYANKVILVIGAPGSGKGTQCKFLSNLTGMMHLSTGDLCREAMRSGTELGDVVSHHLERRELVPDSVMIDVVKECLAQPEAAAKGVLLDGYPRTLKQAWSLVQNKSIEIDRVILLQASNNVCTERIMGRRVDPITADTYNVNFQECMTSDEDVAKRLIRRINDSDESVIGMRLSFFEMNLGQILQCFQGKIFSVNGGRNVYDVYEDIKQILYEPIIQSTVEKKEKTIVKNVDQLCAVCFDQPANFLVIPCGHQCGCLSCLSIIMQDSYPKCPICRSDMDRIVQVFRSGIDKEFDEVVDEVVDIAEQADLFSFQEEDDGGWGAFDQLGTHNTITSDFESYVAENMLVTVDPCDDIDDQNRENVDISITIQPPDIDETHRVPVDICCVIDVSGSMKTKATYQDPNDETKVIDDGFTILDIVIHAVKTVIHSLTDQDRLSLVVFNAESAIAFSLSEMNDGGKEQAIHQLEKLKPAGKTNIWAGLESGLNSLFTSTELLTETTISRKKHIFLLTDGQPVNSPPEGEVAALQEYLESYADTTCQIHTFGFGYSLKSELLLDLARYGNGTTSFIPDAKIIGTCFVNAVANACSTLSQKTKVHLVAKGGASFAGAVGGDLTTDQTTWGIVVQLGPLQYGQARDIVVPMNIPGNTSEYLKVTVEYENSRPNLDSHKIFASGTSRSTSPDSVASYIRNYTVKTEYDIILSCEGGKGKEGIRKMNALIGKVMSYESVHQDPRITGLLADVDGRMKKALSTVQRWNRWGKHYLRAITRSHQLQARTNYMDTGLQCYGGTLFNFLQAQGGEIFLSLPLVRLVLPPNKTVNTNNQNNKGKGNQNKNQNRKNQKNNQNNKGNGNQNKKNTTNTNNNRNQNQNQGKPSYSSTYVPPVQTQPEPEPEPYVATDTYYGGGGCFDASCEIIVIDSEGKEKKTNVSNVERNDQVKVVDMQGKITSGTVQYIVKMNLSDKPDMVKFLDTGLLLTKNHPVMNNGKWQKPKDLVNSQNIVSFEATSNAVYNFVLLEKQVGLLVNNIECVTFGHGIKDAWHPFYASSKVLSVIESLDHNNGFLSVQGSLKYL